MSKINKIHRPQGYWNDMKNILSEIKLRYDNNQSLLASQVLKDNNGLAKAIYKNFNKWTDAIKETEK
jgi:hypothetical protein